MDKINTIVVPIIRTDYILRCLETLHKYTPPNFSVIVVDQSIPNPEWEAEVRKLCDLHIKSCKWNYGFAQAANFGIRLAPTEYVTVLNDDTEAMPKWWEGILATFEKFPTAMGVNPMSPLEPGWGWGKPGFIEHLAYKREFTEDDVKKLIESRKGQVIDGICVWGTVFKRRELLEIGLFDERFTPGSGEDYDLCYDVKTQVVTKNGLKFFSDITFEDELLTLRSNGVMEYHKPLRIIKKFEREMLLFDSKRINLMVSKNQRLLVGKSKLKNQSIEELDLISAGEINAKLYPDNSYYFVKKNGGCFLGEEPKEINIESCRFPAETFMRFMGWYLSEGCVKIKRNHIAICQSEKNGKNREEIRRVIQELGFTPISEVDRIYFRSPELAKYCHELGNSKEKFLPPNLKALAPTLLNEFLQAFIKGDGNISAGIPRMFTASEKLKDDLIEILLKTGNSFNLHERGPSFAAFSGQKFYISNGGWLLHFVEKRKERAFLRKADTVEYNDFAYDVTVPNSVIYVIRNGKGCWSGNCARVYQRGYRLLSTSLSWMWHHWGQSKEHMTEIKTALPQARPSWNKLSVKCDPKEGLWDPDCDVWGKNCRRTDPMVYRAFL